MLSSTVIPSTSPCALRSSGTRPIPARIASRGEASRTGLPSIRTSPRSNWSAPKIARATSVRPEPTKPARPTISPARTSKLMSLRTIADGSRAVPVRLRLRTSSTGRAAASAAEASFWKRSPRLRPTIRRTILSGEASAIGISPTLRPSRRTVTRSQTAITSSSRCEM